MTAGVSVSLACASVAVAAPLLLAALGEVVVERAGIINVGIEGMMLFGAYAAFAAAHASGSPVVGGLAAAAAGMAGAAILAYLSVRCLADQVVVGTALNILALGLTGVITPALSVLRDTPSFQSIRLASIAGQPVEFDLLTLLAIVSVPLISVFLSRTRAGLRLRAAGEYPSAAADAGASVRRLRTGAILFGGAMAGAAGAFLAMADYLSVSGKSARTRCYHL